MKIKVIKNNENILSSRDLNNITKRRKILKKLTSKEHYLLKDLISDKKEIVIKNINNEEEIIFYDVAIVFNWFKDNLFRVYKEWEKLSSNDRKIYVYWNKVSVNYLLFFLTRPHLSTFIKLHKRWNFIKSVYYKDILQLPILKPKKKSPINNKALTKVIEELLIAEKEKMYFVVNILAGSIVEFILEDVIDKELLQKKIIKDKIKDKFKMMEWLIDLCKIYNLINDDRILTKIKDIQRRRNMIHPKALENWIWDIENHSIDTIIDLEEIILYYWL